MRATLITGLILGTSLFSATTFADGNTSIEILGGPMLSSASTGNVDSDVGFTLGAKLRMKALNIEVMPTYFGKMDSKNIGDSYLEIRSLNLGISRDFRLNSWLRGYGQLGVSYWTMDLYLIGEKRGEDNGVSPWLGLGLDYEINNFIHLYAGFRQHFDISGSDISVLTGQIGFEF